MIEKAHALGPANTRASSTSTSCSTKRRLCARKHYRDLKPIAPGFFGYSVIRNSVHSEQYLETLDLCEKMRFPLEALHEETGPGVLEAAIAVDHGLEAADRAALFKTFVKIHAQRKGRMVTFMASGPRFPGRAVISMSRLETAPARRCSSMPPTRTA
jgi:hypothetical protein